MKQPKGGTAPHSLRRPNGLYQLIRTRRNQPPHTVSPAQPLSACCRAWRYVHSPDQVPRVCLNPHRDTPGGQCRLYSRHAPVARGHSAAGGLCSLRADAPARSSALRNGDYRHESAGGHAAERTRGRARRLGSQWRHERERVDELHRDAGRRVPYPIQWRTGAGSFVSIPRGTAHALVRRGRRPLIVFATLSGAPCEEPR